MSESLIPNNGLIRGSIGGVVTFFAFTLAGTEQGIIACAISGVAVGATTLFQMNAGRDGFFFHAFRPAGVALACIALAAITGHLHHDTHQRPPATVVSPQ